MSTRVDTPSLRRPNPARLNVPGLTGVLTAEGALPGTRERWVPYRGLKRCPYRYRGPRFTLSGTVYFRPLQPFAPDSQFPSQSVRPPHVSVSDFEFVYPDHIVESAEVQLRQ